MKSKIKPLEVHKVEVPFEEHEHTLQFGLRIEWFSGEANGVKVRLTAGAGVGSPYLIFTQKQDGKERNLVLDVRKLQPILSNLLSK